MIISDISVNEIGALETNLDPETLNKQQKYLVEMEELFFKIYFSMKFAIENDIKGFESINSFYSPYAMKLLNFHSSDKSETYKIKKGETRKKRMRTGSIIQGYREILAESYNELKNIILNFILDKENLGNLIKEKDKILNELEDTNIKINRDFNILLRNVYNVLDINKFVYNLSRNLSDKNIFEQSQALRKYLQGMLTTENITHDELININNLLNNFNINYLRRDDNTLKRENTLSLNSFLYVKCKEIINNNNISIENRQILLESFILSYEKEFTLNIIKNMKNNIKDFKLITRIYKHSTPQFVNRINSLIEDFKKRNFDLYHKSMADPGKLGDILVLGLFISNKPEELTNIILSKVVRLVGLSGGIKQTDLLAMISEELFITLKYSLKNKDNKVSDLELEIIKDIQDKLDFVTVESKFRFGNFLIDFIFEEFSYIFSKINYYEGGEQYIYITITAEYLSVLSASLFNPIKLPMIAMPKIWDFLEKDLTFTQIGGYYLEEFNELNKNNNIIRQNSFNKYNSSVSIQQVKSINFLNSKGFNINTEMLDFVVSEWNKNEHSIIFNNFNKLHPLTNNLDKLTSIKKREVISHNSKYWSYSNIINIALLMKDQTIYFPTFLDFRGRIYPTPNYLSYQSNDLARSLLLFESNNQLEDSNNYLSILEQILNDDIYNKDKNKNKKNYTLSDIDYLKLYLANVYGKNKLTRAGRINWVNKNIEEMINIYEEDINLFNSKYVKLSKEPFQFVACFLAYYRYIKYNELINIPILFDATCSGIQHLSALSKDAQIAGLVNLLENEEPSDFYQYCINQVLNIINLLPKEHQIIKNKLDKLNISRKWLKQSIMTIPYNVTNMGIAEKLSSNFNKIYIPYEYKEKLDRGELTLKELTNMEFKIPKEEKGLYILIPKAEMLNDNVGDNNYLYFTNSEMLFLANIIKQTVINIIPSFNQLKIYFDEIIVILQKIGLPLFWETPSGMSVSMSTVKMTSKRVKNNFLKKSKPISLLIPTEQIDYRHIKTGLMPNFIHSLDASNIHILIKNIYKFNIQNINLYTIHDCFASDIKNIRLIELLVKHSFIELYFRRDYLNSVHTSFLKQIQSYTQIFEEKPIDGNKQYILVRDTKTNKYNKTEKLILPCLPNFEWSIDKDKVLYDILFNSYFIS
uniref:DNA-directed RNA polymerase n=1 Tax=Lyophyllum shimeji TaxID=47721 RepID=A0A8F1AD85_LYOSH|nr:RNA polymerase [Lyophyllum shimeji]